MGMCRTSYSTRIRPSDCHFSPPRGRKPVHSSWSPQFLGNTSSQAGVLSMQSYMMAFFPNTAAANQGMHSLYNNWAHIFEKSSENTSLGFHVIRKMAHLPVLLLKRFVFLAGSAILTIAIHYRALIDIWLLQMFAVSQGAQIHCAMILRFCYQRRSLPLFVGGGVLMARLYNSITIPNHIYGRQLTRGVEANLQGRLLIQNNDLCNQESFLPSLLGSKHDYVRLVLQCICSTAILKVHTVPKVISFQGRCVQKNHVGSAFRKIVSKNGQYLTYIGALATLQIFLQLNRVNTTTSLLPLLSQTTSLRSKASVVSNIVIILVNSIGILGSSFTVKHHGRAATLTVSSALMVFCQTAIPFIVEFHTGLGGGSRMPRGFTIAMFVLTCVVSCGLSWSWGSLLWTVPGDKKIQSAGQVAGIALGVALCFAQMKYFLVILCRQKNAILAYYAMWMWS
ncbi:hypothetical protein BRADI_3g46650v3 [Brachypodium distachyon]|uniref:Uncharacterized protein n=1 Tax=Brachypodium distachyon TaxID=15368 RepID=A0A2K2D3M7_BRADI|nr:hypothetical protein BRADI_3g46650v3 [Brachypodium distachyon]